MWDYPLEYVFYGIATIAIWTIINVFMEMSAETIDEPESKVSHSRSFFDFRRKHLKEAAAEETAAEEETSEREAATTEAPSKGSDQGNSEGKESEKVRFDVTGDEDAEVDEPVGREGVHALPPTTSYTGGEDPSQNRNTAYTYRIETEELIVKEERTVSRASPSDLGRTSADDIDQNVDKGGSLVDAKATIRELVRREELAGKEEQGAKAVDWKLEWISPAPLVLQTDEKRLDRSDVTGDHGILGRTKGHRDWRDDIGQVYREETGYLKEYDKEFPSYRRLCHVEDPSQDYLIKRYFGAELKPHQKSPPVPNGIERHSHEERNLLKNNCGQLDLEFWALKSKSDDWVVEKNPDEKPPSDQHGEPLPEFNGYTSSFETTNRMGKKEQVVDLIAEGYTAEYLDEVQPPIEVSEWITIPAECRSTYELRVKLLNQEKETISDYQHDHSFSSIKETKWKKVSHTFREYGPGARYVLFSHGAVKWYGKRGSKMSGAVVRVLNSS